MKVATLQFDPTLGNVTGNIRHADAMLKNQEVELAGLDILVLPELAFTGEWSFDNNVFHFLSLEGFVVYSVRDMR
jgi:predicted amidohydrolase